MTTLTDQPTVPDQPRTSRRAYWIGLAILAAITIFTAVRLTQGYPLFGPRELHGFVLEQPAPIGNFQLTAAHNNEPVALSDFRGQIVLLYFGYAYCPDICPMTSLQLAKARAALPERFQDDVQVLMVTVDPERDTPEKLTKYLQHFDESFIGLTGTHEEIAAAAAPIGIFYERRDSDDSEKYFVDHTATVAVLDRQGLLRSVWPFGVTAEEIASDLGYWVRE